MLVRKRNNRPAGEYLESVRRYSFYSPSTYSCATERKKEREEKGGGERERAIIPRCRAINRIAWWIWKGVAKFPCILLHSVADRDLAARINVAGARA